MKSPHPQQAFNKQKLPYIQFSNIKKNHNQSLKKLLNNPNQINIQSSSLNNIGLLPRLQQKTKIIQIQDKKNSQTSLQKNIVKWNTQNPNLKKRQKLQTQGPASQQITQGQQSFVSLTNKILRHDQDVKDTMFDFRKKIQQNKLIIKKQIEKKNKQNHTLIKRQKSIAKKKRVNSSRFLLSPQQQRKSKKTLQTPVSKSKLQISLKQRSSSKKQKNIQERKRRQKTQMQHTEHQSTKVLPKRNSQGLFTDLQVILDDKMRPQQQKSIKQQTKLRALLSKLSKFKQQKNYSIHSIGQTPHSLHSMSDHVLHLQQSTDTLSPTTKLKLKKQANYHEWNKVDLSVTSQITYRKSSFQEQLRKVAEYTDRNDASLQKYLGMRKELLKLGFQVQLGHCAGRTK